MLCSAPKLYEYYIPGRLFIIAIWSGWRDLQVSPLLLKISKIGFFIPTPLKHGEGPGRWIDRWAVFPSSSSSSCARINCLFYACLSLLLQRRDWAAMVAVEREGSFYYYDNNNNPFEFSDSSARYQSKKGGPAQKKLRKRGKGRQTLWKQKHCRIFSLFLTEHKYSVTLNINIKQNNIFMSPILPF